jgi:small redox-active disulfide protein 2
MKIQVIGAGCMKCNEAFNNAKWAVRELGVDVDVEKVEDIKKIVEFGVMSTPAIAIDGEVKVSGKVPTVEEIKRLIEK